MHRAFPPGQSAVTNNSDVQDSQKLGSVCFNRGLVPRAYPYKARLLHRCTVRPMTVRVSLLRSYSQLRMSDVSTL
eukprot:3382272-Pyramimonas_sp.AAC.1